MKPIAKILIGLAFINVLLFCDTGVAAPVGTTFRFTGSLAVDGVPIEGTADFEFAIWDAASGGNVLGNPINPIGVPISKGLFVIDLDFGPGVFNGEQRWLEIGLRSPSGVGSFTTITPRTLLGATPYAQALPGLFTETNAESPNLIGGYFGNTVTSSVVGATIGGGGRSDAPNEVTASHATVGGGRGNSASKLSATIGGGSDNRVAGLFGTIAGGGTVFGSDGMQAAPGNRVFDDYGSIGGGGGNEAGTDDSDSAGAKFATVGGGENNTASGAHSTVGGGNGNAASALGATVGGGGDNTAAALYGTIAGGGKVFGSDGIQLAPGNRVFDDYGAIGGGGGNEAGSDDSDSASAQYATIGGGERNKSAGDHATVGGGLENSASASTATVGGGSENVANRLGATVGGGGNNSADALFGTIAGGGTVFGSDGIQIAPGNRVFDDYGTIAGGGGNEAGTDDDDSITAKFAMVGGGERNKSAGDHATIGGGLENSASASNATVSGGSKNVAGGLGATVGGGGDNNVNALYGTVAGEGRVFGSDGTQAFPGNRVFDDYGFVGGGGGNEAGNNDGDSASAQFATVGGGINNKASGDSATVGGGADNVASAEAATICGGNSNRVTATFGTIAGGGWTDPFAPETTYNRVLDVWGTIGGGGNNQAGSADGDQATAAFATISGGADNVASAEAATIGGGEENSAEAYTASIGGGLRNLASGAGSTVAGGQDNDAIGDGCTISGGIDNTADSNNSTVGGGDSNNASADRSTIAGGVFNQAGGQWSTVGGGALNAAFGIGATIPGGHQNEALGNMSFAAGLRAKARHGGAFVWGDETDADFASTGPNQFLVRASGGTRIYSDNTASSGVILSPGSGTWSSVSDRNLKENVLPVDGRAVLEKLANVPIGTWNYKTQDASIRHMGPMGQDFHEAFAIGEDPRRISTIDADGVALAAIQGLLAITQEQATELAALRAARQSDAARAAEEIAVARMAREREIEALRAVVSDLNRRMADLEAASPRDASSPTTTDRPSAIPH